MRITASKIDEYLKIYEKYEDIFNIVKTELDRINMKFQKMILNHYKS